MQSLQHHAKMVIFTQDVEYSHIKPHTYRSVGLPEPRVLEALKALRLAKNPDKGLTNVETLDKRKLRRKIRKRKYAGLTISARMGCVTSLRFFRNIIDEEMEYDHLMGIAAFNGHIEIIEQFKGWGAENFSWPMYMASKGGQIDVVRLLISWAPMSKYPIDYEDAISTARFKGHHDIVKLLSERDPSLINAEPRYYRFG
jgi:hypothetical protein